MAMVERAVRLAQGKGEREGCTIIVRRAKGPLDGLQKEGYIRWPSKGRIFASFLPSSCLDRVSTLLK